MEIFKKTAILLFVLFIGGGAIHLVNLMVSVISFTYLEIVALLYMIRVTTRVTTHGLKEWFNAQN